MQLADYSFELEAVLSFQEQCEPYSKSTLTYKSIRDHLLFNIHNSTGYTPPYLVIEPRFCTQW